MKNKYNFKIFLFLLFFGSGFILKANIDTVLVGPSGTMSFSPNQFTVNLGDSILWMWESGFHTTTSTSVPPGATSWDHPMNSSSMEFLYIPSMVGNYNYQCTPHSSVMKASFTVVSTTGLDEFVLNDKISISPSLGKGTFHFQTDHVELRSAVIKVFDTNGKQVLNKKFKHGKEVIDIREESSGVYLIEVYTGGKRYHAKYVKE